MASKRNTGRDAPRQRNYAAANNPLLRKSGPHGKTRKAQRRKDKQREWKDE